MLGVQPPEGVLGVALRCRQVQVTVPVDDGPNDTTLLWGRGACGLAAQGQHAGCWWTSSLRGRVGGCQ